MKPADSAKNVIIYCRESRDDGYENIDRIETQKEILIEFCKRRSLGHILDVVMDDNISGTSFERLEPVKERVRKGEVDIFLCKDASRLGRNILESLMFTEFLAAHQVELIFESERYDEDMFPLIAWFNERRVKDDSGKIRRVLRHKMESGEMVVKAPYGYVKEGNTLKINERIAPIVQEIFKLYTEGQSMREIAVCMNERRYPTPSQLKSEYGGAKCTAVWNRGHIDRILGHLAYTGDMPYGMREKLSYKSKRYIHKSREEWIVIPDHHASIVDKAVFKAAQERRCKTARNKPRISRDNTFSGLLYCGCCGSRMKRKERKRRKASYVCAKNDREGAFKDVMGQCCGCAPHRISEEALYLLVRDYIEKFLGDITFYNRIEAELLKAVSYRFETEKQAGACERKINELRRKASVIYDDKLNGLLPDFLFQEKMDRISQDIAAYEERLGNFRKAAQDAADEAQRKYTLEPVIAAMRDSGIDNYTVSMLFQRILVFCPGDITPGHKAKYSLTDNAYELIHKEGGLVFVQNFEYSYVLLPYTLDDSKLDTQRI